MKVYTSSNCPNCIALKNMLKAREAKYDEIDATTTKVVAFLRARKLPLQLPLIEIDNVFYTFEQYKETIND